MSPQASTSSARDVSPYWSEFTREISSELWSPTDLRSSLGSQPCQARIGGGG